MLYDKVCFLVIVNFVTYIALQEYSSHPKIQRHKVNNEPTDDVLSSSSDDHPVRDFDSRGSRYSSDRQDKQGRTVKEGYNSKQNKGTKHSSKYSDDYNRGKYNRDGTIKKSNQDDGDYYETHQRGAKNGKASKFGEKSGHKKGHKTKGYHNKFYRDEIHREHKFYDDAHKSGHYDKNGNKHEHYENKSGGGKKSGHSSSGRHQDGGGKKGHFDRGSSVDEHKGHTKTKGYQSHGNKISSFGQDGDSFGGNWYSVHED